MCYVEIFVFSSRVSRMNFLAKTTTISFFDRLTRRKNIVLFEWCSFSFATYIKGFYYVIVDFLRGSEAENKIFERRYRISFLMNWTIVENLSNVICVLSNKINCDEGFHNPHMSDPEKIARIVITAIENRV